jgi:hypothetical protein
MLFHEVFVRLVAIFAKYEPTQNNVVAAAKAKEHQKILDHLSPFTNQTLKLLPSDIFASKDFFEDELRSLSAIRQEAEGEYPEAGLDGFVRTAMKVLENLLHYWSISALSIEYQKSILSKIKGSPDTHSILIPTLADVREDDPLGILQFQLILFLIDVDIRFELQKAPKSTKNNFYSMGFSLVSSILPINNDHAEDKLKTDVYNHLIKMKALLPAAQNDDIKYMKFIDEALNEAIGYEAQQTKIFGTKTTLKRNLNTASIQITALPQLKQYKETLKIMCDAVVKDSRRFFKYLGTEHLENTVLTEGVKQKKPEEEKRASMSEKSSPELGPRGSESLTAASLPALNTPPIENPILTATETAVPGKPEETKRASISGPEEQPLVIFARTSISSLSASPPQASTSPAANPTPLALTEVSLAESSPVEPEEQPAVSETKKKKTKKRAT